MSVQRREPSGSHEKRCEATYAPQTSTPGGVSPAETIAIVAVPSGADQVSTDFDATAETIRGLLTRRGQLDRAMEYLHGSYPRHHVERLEQALGWMTDCECGAAMRRLVDAHHAYAGIIGEITGDLVPVDQLVENLLVLVVG